MPLGDVSEKQKHVSSYYGADTSLIPASFDVALFTGNPYDDASVEVDYPGYARVTLTNDTATFVPDVDGSGMATALASFPDATDAATTDDAKTWVMFPHGSTAIDSWEWLAAPVAINGAGTIEDIEVTPYVPDDANVDS